MIGRAYQYGLGAMGKAGISKCLEILRKELDLTMGFCGANEITDISKNNIL
nr:alpha-hydroxy-acid oxidizing protein [Pseudomonadales bacterium]